MAFIKKGEPAKIIIMESKKFKKIKCKKCKKVIGEKDNRIIKVGNTLSMGVTIITCPYCGEENII